MSGIEKRIEEVFAQHRRCHERTVVAGMTHCAGCNHWVPDFDAHVAAAVVQALGLKQESSTYEKFETKSESGGEGNMRWGGQTSRSLGYRTSTRLVSEWVES